MIEIYTDGACSKNPGPGGWGVYIIIGKEEIKLSGNDPETTNNKMEMTATIEALKYFKESKKIKLYTDSNYIYKGINEWIDGWKKRDWKTSGKKPVKNKELWMELDKLNDFHTVNWYHVPAHSGIEGNEIADKLAVEARLKL